MGLLTLDRFVISLLFPCSLLAVAIHDQIIRARFRKAKAPLHLRMVILHRLRERILEHARRQTIVIRVLL